MNTSTTARMFGKATTAGRGHGKVRTNKRAEAQQAAAEILEDLAELGLTRIRIAR